MMFVWLNSFLIYITRVNDPIYTLMNVHVTSHIIIIHVLVKINHGLKEIRNIKQKHKKCHNKSDFGILMIC